MKKSTKLILTSTMLLSLMACGGSKETAKVEKKGIEGATVNVYLFEPVGSPEGLTKVSKKINEYVKNTYNYNANVIFYGNDYDEKMNIKVATGEAWDIMLTSNLSASNSYAKNAQEGVYLDLAPYLTTTMKDTAKIVTMETINRTAYKGKPYAIKGSITTNFNTVVWYDKNVMNKVGITDLNPEKDIQSLEALTPYLEKVAAYNKANGVQILGYQGPDRVTKGYGEYDFVLGLPDRLIGLPIKGGEPVSFYESDYFKTLSKNLNKFYEKGYMKYDPNNPFSAARTEFLFYAGNGNSDRNGTAQEMSKATKKDLGALFMTNSFVSVGAALTDVLVVANAHTKNAEATTHFMNLLYADKTVANTLQFGVEGEHWTFANKDKGIIKRTALANTEFFGDYWWGQGGVPGTLYIPEGQEDWKLYGELTESAKKSLIVSDSLGFFFDPSPVRNEVAAITNIMAKYNNITMGLPQNWAEGYDKFIAEMKGAGLDKVKAEVKKQYDEWKATPKK